MFKIDKERAIVEDLNYPGYDDTADIEVINENFRKLKEKNESQDNAINGKEPKINKKSGFNLDKTDVPENNTNNLFTAKGALDLKNWLVTAYTNAINTTKSALENLIKTKLPHGGYGGTAKDLKNLVDSKEPKITKKSGFNLDKTDVPENNTNKLFTAKGALDLKNWIVTAYTNAINTTKSALENLIKTKLPHGGYGGTGQDLKNLVDSKEPKIKRSSSVTSTSETDVATSKAVKSANDNANTRLKNGYQSTDFGGNTNNITTAQFLQLIKSKGAFQQSYWVGRGSWYYAGNQKINDTGCGDIHLAGAVVEVFGTEVNHTIRITTPTTSVGGIVNAEFIYVNNGKDYTPGWRRSYNTKNKPTPAEIGTYTKQEIDSRVNGRLPSNGKAVDSSKLNGIVNSTGATANTIAQRDSAGDINVRLVRSNYGNESRMTGAVAFRVNTSDNYIRFCSDPSAFRNWINASHRGKADLLWSGGHYMDGGAVLSLNGKNFDQYQMIIVHCSIENDDKYRYLGVCNLTLTTASYGVTSMDCCDLVDSDWCGAYLVNNYQIKPFAGSGVWIRRVYGIR